MTAEADQVEEGPDGTTRRAFLGYLAAGSAGAVMGGGAVAAVNSATSAEPTADSAGDVGAQSVPFFGQHQAGIATPAQASAAFVAFDLPERTSKDQLRGLLRDWTDAAADLTRGVAASGDDAVELAELPANLTITLGLGASLFDRWDLAAERPPGVVDFPPFQHDELQRRWSGGDLVLQICADDSLVVSNAVRTMRGVAGGRAEVRWLQRGFQRHSGVAEGQTARNLMGNKDGTGNDRPGTPGWDQTVWAQAPNWFAGGTTMVIRRIRMDLESWFRADLRTKDRTIGRHLDSGAPIGQDEEFDQVPLSAQATDGSLVIPSSAHVRLAHPDSNNGARMFRRGYNYDDGDDAGLIFVAIGADATRGFLPVQSRIAAGDDLNRFTTAIGTATFAVVPGVQSGQYLGQPLLG